MTQRRNVSPDEVISDLDSDARIMDNLEKAIGAACDALDQAEETWLILYDQIAETLKDEMVEEGRKGDPAEHWITTITRRQHRAEYTTWRRARRAWEALERQRQAKEKAMSARQSELNGMRDGLKVYTTAKHNLAGTQPAPDIIGGRRVA